MLWQSQGRCYLHCGLPQGWKVSGHGVQEVVIGSFFCFWIHAGYCSVYIYFQMADQNFSHHPFKCFHYVGCERNWSEVGWKTSWTTLVNGNHKGMLHHGWKISINQEFSEHDFQTIHKRVFTLFQKYCRDAIRTIIYDFKNYKWTVVVLLVAPSQKNNG